MTVDAEEIAECQAFLTWLRDDHFALLGSRIYRFEGEPETVSLTAPAETGIANIGFVLYHLGIAVNDFRFLTPATTSA